MSEYRPYRRSFGGNLPRDTLYRGPIPRLIPFSKGLEVKFDPELSRKNRAKFEQSKSINGNEEGEILDKESLQERFSVLKSAFFWLIRDELAKRIVALAEKTGSRPVSEEILVEAVEQLLSLWFPPNPYLSLQPQGTMSLQELTYMDSDAVIKKMEEVYDQRWLKNFLKQAAIVGELQKNN